MCNVFKRTLALFTALFAFHLTVQTASPTAVQRCPSWVPIPSDPASEIEYLSTSPIHYHVRDKVHSVEKSR